MRGVVALLTAAALLAGCSAWKAPADPQEASLGDRAVTASRDGVTLRAAILSPEDSRRIFGTDLIAADIQPIWVEVDNATDQVLFLLRTGTDPDYFSSLEVAWPLHAAFDREGNREVDAYFHDRSFRNPIAPHTTVSGIIFTNPQPRQRLLTVDLIGDSILVPFSVFVQVPGQEMTADDATVAQSRAGPDVPDYGDLDALRAALEQLPCCSQTAGGEPFNVILIGELTDVATALGRRGFRRAEPGEAMAFGRPPDYEVRRYAQAGAPSDRLRLWFAPMRFQGRPVVLAQVLRPAGGRFAPADQPFVAHPNVDEARNLFIQDAFYSGGLERLGFVGGVPPVQPGTPGKGYQTDGARAVLFFTTRPLALSDVELLDWLPLLDEQVRRAEAAD
jgi:hypothetical protein